MQNSDLTYTFDLRKPTPSTIPRLRDSTDVGSVPVPLADLLVPQSDFKYSDITHDTLEDTDSKMSELPED